MNIVGIEGQDYRKVKAKYRGKWYTAFILESEYQNNRTIRKAKSNKRHIIELLDTLWSQSVRSIGYCEKCGKNENLQAHHIFSRKHKSTRWEIENGVCLCFHCHIFWAHKEAKEFMDWIIEKCGEQLIDRLSNKSKMKVIYSEKELEFLYDQMKGESDYGMATDKY